MKMRIHYNKRAINGLVWSIVTSKACYHAKKVNINTTSYTEFKPEKKHPNAFIVVNGDMIQIKKGVAYIA